MRRVGVFILSLMLLSVVSGTHFCEAGFQRSILKGHILKSMIMVTSSFFFGSVEGVATAGKGKPGPRRRGPGGGASYDPAICAACIGRRERRRGGG